jgi:triphosphoribosyl-dephospho-CoA synthase
MTMADDTTVLEHWIRTACVMEVTAPKPGNVHPGARFEDVSFDDFVRSAEVIAPVLARAGDLGVGWVMLEAVRTTREAVGRNTNLGIVLLLAPLAAVPVGRTLQTGIATVLGQLSVDDARHCYAAIRLAMPGGLGTAEQADVSTEPNVNLVAAMTLAADRDSVAKQYANGFADVLTWGLPVLADCYDACRWQESVVRLQLQLMARLPDTLIARKCGWDVARQSQHQAQAVLAAGWPDQSFGKQMMSGFDRWLRSDGHRRNPGTTADLVAAILFAGLREGVVDVPADLNHSA